MPDTYVHFMGDDVSLPRMIQHYRNMARRQPGKALFWRTRCRVLIAAYREQVA